MLLAALGLLERTDGPVILEDFTEAAPGRRDTLGWTPPSVPAPRGNWAADLAAEIAALMPLWRRAGMRFGRSTVGISRLPPEAWPGFAAAFLEGPAPESGPHGSPALSLRYVADDLKAFAFEAAQAEGPAPSSRQVNDWFWPGTVAGRMLVALRGVAMTSESRGMQTVARFLVPVPNLPPGSA